MLHHIQSVKVTSLPIDAESALGFSFGVHFCNESSDKNVDVVC